MSHVPLRCAWCEREAGTVVVLDIEDAPVVSHGICQMHLERMFAGLSRKGATPWQDAIK